ncbi:HEPN domain-containing protein [Tateyamaria pelophila]|uniref:HEPN domain-containing protein n=1 Tax=Tateyamaria pelophila TaxID=328415 RepID=UPI001CBBB6DE
MGTFCQVASTKHLVSSIKDTSDTTRLATQLFDLINRDLPYWQSEGPIGSPLSEERFNKGFASPSFNKIASYFGRFGHVDYKRDLGFILAGDFATCKTLINHIVDIRNKIAHGNPSLSKTPSDLLDAASTVQVFCRSTDDVFARWCKQNLCPIR